MAGHISERALIYLDLRMGGPGRFLCRLLNLSASDILQRSTLNEPNQDHTGP